MLIRTVGIVFKSIKYSETSLICTIYTAKHGLRQYIINGVRSKKARMQASLFQPMTILDIVAYERNNKAINRLKEAKFQYVYRSIPFDLKKGAVGLFMIEVAQKTIKEGTENAELFCFLEGSFKDLDATTAPLSNFPIAYLIQLSAFLGFMPNLEKPSGDYYFNLQEGIFTATPPQHSYYIDPGISRTFCQLLGKSYEEVVNMQLPKQDRQSLLNHLIDYYRLHVEGLSGFNTPGILNDVLKS